MRRQNILPHFDTKSKEHSVVPLIITGITRYFALVHSITLSKQRPFRSDIVNTQSFMSHYSTNDDNQHCNYLWYLKYATLPGQFRTQQLFYLHQLTLYFRFSRTNKIWIVSIRRWNGNYSSLLISQSRIIDLRFDFNPLHIRDVSWDVSPPICFSKVRHELRAPPLISCSNSGPWHPSMRSDSSVIKNLKDY